MEGPKNTQMNTVVNGVTGFGRDAQSGEICALEVTDNRTNKASVVPAFLPKIPIERKTSSATEDSAYDKRNCHKTIAQRSANAVIPTRRNTSFWGPDKSDYEACNETLREVKRLARTILKKWSELNKRSLSEIKMHCFKLLADRVKSKSLQSHITMYLQCNFQSLHIYPYMHCYRYPY